MPGTLYLVATPIGNLDDMPPRVAATFAAADFVAAEDTRVTLRLLNHLGLKKPLVSYYEHALHHGAAILARIQAGEDCALCSDAGMPCISDPGAVLVRDALDAGIRVVPVPGASACITALAVSGQDTARFVFEGFLPRPKKERRARLEALRREERTILLYEAHLSSPSPGMPVSVQVTKPPYASPSGSPSRSVSRLNFRSNSSTA